MDSFTMRTGGKNIALRAGFKDEKDYFCSWDGGHPDGD